MNSERRNAEGGKRRAVFLDRDGVINRALVRDGKPYPPRSLEELEILPGVVEACDRLRAAGFLLVVATNQPDVGRGTLNRDTLDQIHAHLRTVLPLDRIEVCPHGGEKFGQPCDCRKPRPGMLLKAAREMGIDLSQSWMVGDRWRDIECGRAAGCHTVFIDYGYSEGVKTAPDRVATTLLEAAVEIIATVKC